MEPVNIGLLGMGTVGGGTVTVLTGNAGEIARRAGRGIRIAHAAARQYDPERIGRLDQIGRISGDAFAVVEDPDIDIAVELIGG
jgi:homoserine dehydrogenase